MKYIKLVFTIFICFILCGCFLDDPKYITFETNIEEILSSLEGNSESIDVNADVSGFIDSVIKSAMEKRASDIHIEPLQKSLRIR